MKANVGWLCLTVLQVVRCLLDAADGGGKVVNLGHRDCEGET